MAKKVYPNDPCPCGSGLKYKECCGSNKPYTKTDLQLVDFVIEKLNEDISFLASALRVVLGTPGYKMGEKYKDLLAAEYKRDGLGEIVEKDLYKVYEIPQKLGAHHIKEIRPYGGGAPSLQHDLLTLIDEGYIRKDYYQVELFHSYLIHNLKKRFKKYHYVPKHQSINSIVEGPFGHRGYDFLLGITLYLELQLGVHIYFLGYSEKENGKWVFHRPRRLPDHLSDVYLIDESNSDAIKTLLGSQLGTEGICIGNLLAGEHPLSNVPVYLPPYAISHHIAIFGRTGCGKSNTMMVLIESMFKNNERVLKTGKGQKVSMLAIDPHDEFLDWHKKSGGRGGIGEITGKYSADEKAALVDPYFYLTPKQIDENGGMARIRISRADIIPEDLISITEFSEQQSQFAGLMYSLHGEMWISKLLSGDLGDDPAIAQYMDATKGAVERRVKNPTENVGEISRNYVKPRCIFRMIHSLSALYLMQK